MKFSSLIFVLSAFKSNVGRRAAQTVEFAKQLKEEIVLVLKQVHRRQTEELNRMERQIEMLGTAAETQFSNMRKYKSKMVESHRVREEEFLRLEILKARLYHSKP